MNQQMKTKLLDLAKELPCGPGCYLMKNVKDEVIYVGKAKDLSKRVKSYFDQSVKTPKTQILVGHIASFDFMLAQSETEALVLENNLIKKHSPKYNIRLKDDKSYPYIVVDMNEPFARPVYRRRIKRGKGILVYGPFVSGYQLSSILRILIKSFQLRDCSIREFHSRKTPCLLYQMKQCSAPCVGQVDSQMYEKDLMTAMEVFQGKGQKVVDILEERMVAAACDEHFEQAAMIRDAIVLIKEFMDQTHQKNAEFEQVDVNADIVSYHIGEIEVDLAIYSVRRSLLLGHKNFHFPLADIGEDIEDELIAILLQYYSQGTDTLPKSFILDFKKSRQKNFIAALKKLQDSKDMITFDLATEDQRFSSLLDLTRKNAIEHQRMRLTTQESEYVGLRKLQELLNLRERPRILECYDVAIWQGHSPTAAKIVFKEGRPQKSDYRYYHLEERPEGNNDFAMMKEVLGRRLLKEKNLPDVIVVDGGKGQVKMVREVLKDYGLTIPVVGLVKERFQNGEKTEERLVIAGRDNPYILKKNPSLFRILTQMRDEAHRFSRKLHHKSELRRQIASWLDEIHGIGPAIRQKVLMSMDQSPEIYFQKTDEELEESLQIGPEKIKTIKKYLALKT